MTLAWPVLRLSYSTIFSVMGCCPHGPTSHEQVETPHASFWLPLGDMLILFWRRSLFFCQLVSLLKGYEAMHRFLLMSLVKTFSTGWNVFETT